MSEQRREYTKPMITQLEFAADTSVNMLQTCKTPNEASGAGGGGCLSTDESPCSVAAS